MVPKLKRLYGGASRTQRERAGKCERSVADKIPPRKGRPVNSVAFIVASRECAIRRTLRRSGGSRLCRTQDLSYRDKPLRWQPWMPTDAAIV